MITDAVDGKIDLILTKSISRFGRNIVDILSTLKLLDELTPPVAVTFESEGISTAEGKNKLIISILSALAELESQQKSIAIKQGMRCWPSPRQNGFIIRCGIISMPVSGGKDRARARWSSTTLSLQAHMTRM